MGVRSRPAQTGRRPKCSPPAPDGRIARRSRLRPQRHDCPTAVPSLARASHEQPSASHPEWMTLVPRIVVALATIPGCLLWAVATEASADQRWPWPLAPAPALVEPFEAPSSVYGPGHRGIDLAGSPGQPVLSATDGLVTFASPVAGRGVVVVRYGELRLTYEPVAASVHVGDRVADGSALGSLAVAGSHCWPDPCLHVGLRQGDVYLDPLPYFGPRQVRLKPLAGDPAPAASLGVQPRDRLVTRADPDRTVSVTEEGSAWSRSGVGRLVGAGAAAAAAAVTVFAVRRRGQARG